MVFFLNESIQLFSMVKESFALEVRERYLLGLSKVYEYDLKMKQGRKYELPL